MKGTWEGSGTWKTDDGPPWLLIIVAAMLCSTGAVAALAMAVMTLLIAVGVLAVLAAAAVAAFVVWRARHPEAAHRFVRPYTVHQLAPEPVAAKPAPREVHYHQHLHIAPGSDLSGLGDLFTGETITEGNQ